MIIPTSSGIDQMIADSARPPTLSDVLRRARSHTPVQRALPNWRRYSQRPSAVFTSAVS
jgi:hypothetical protein